LFILGTVFGAREKARKEALLPPEDVSSIKINYSERKSLLLPLPFPPSPSLTGL
jgi:hypothetical protein